MDTVDDRTDKVDEERRDNGDDVIVISGSDESLVLAPASKNTESAVVASASKDNELSSNDSDSEFAGMMKQCPLCCLE